MNAALREELLSMSRFEKAEVMVCLWPKVRHLVQEDAAAALLANIRKILVGDAAANDESIGWDELRGGIKIED